MVVQHFIAIEVKVFDHLLEIRGLQLTISVLSLELSDRLGINIARTATINPPEGTVGLKVPHRAQYLS